MRIIHFCFSLDSSKGGVSRGVVEIVRHLTLSGIENQIVSAGKTVQQRQDFFEIELELKTMGVEVIDTISKFENDYGLGSLRGFRVKISKLPKSDLVVLHQIYSLSTLLGYIYAKRRNIPYAVMPHGSLTSYHESISKLRKKIAHFVVISRVLKNANAIIVTCENEKNDLRPSLRNKAYKLGYGADKKGSLDEEVARTFNLQEPPHILFSGRFDRKKNLQLVLRALPDVLRIFPNLILDIAGAGSTVEHREINRLISSLKLETNIKFHGWVNSLEMEKLLTASKLLVLPSENENFALVVSEALSAGVPCVVSKFVGTADVVAQHRAGEVIGELTTIAVASAILKVLQGDAVRYKSAAYQAIEYSLDWSRVVSEWKLLVESLATDNILDKSNHSATNNGGVLGH